MIGFLEDQDHKKLKKDMAELESKKQSQQENSQADTPVSQLV